jgi:hypothetical protein
MLPPPPPLLLQLLDMASSSTHFKLLFNVQAAYQ